MRIVVYCPRNFRGLIDGAIRAASAEFYHKWPAFETAVRGADCAVVVIEDLSATPGPAELAGLRRLDPGIGLVLVTRLDRQNGRRLPATTADAVVPLDEVHDELPEAVLGAADGMCAQLARHIRWGPSCSTELQTVLLGIVLADQPPWTVDKWAGGRRLCSAFERRMERAFAREFGSGICPGFFLRSVRLFHALDRSPERTSWARLAKLAHSHQRTVKSLAIELNGVTVLKSVDLNRDAMVTALVERLR